MYDTLSTLNWLVEAGADEGGGGCAGETGWWPGPRWRNPPPQRRALRPARRCCPRWKAMPSARAQAAAAAANTLDDLKAALEAFDGCALKRTAANTVFADGVAAGRG